MNKKLEIRIKRKYFSVAMFLFIFLNTLFFGSFISAKQSDVCAQRYIGSGGASCIPHYSECPAGYKNLPEALSEGGARVKNTNISKEKLEELAETKFGEGSVNYACIPETTDLNDIFVLAAGSGTRLSSCGDGFTMKSVTGSNGYTEYAGENILIVVSGCCPSNSNSVLVTFEGTAATFAHQDAAICCEIPPGASPGDDNYPHHEYMGTCHGKNNQEIPTSRNLTGSDRSNFNGKDIYSGVVINTPISTDPSKPKDVRVYDCPAGYGNGCYLSGVNATPGDGGNVVGVKCERCFNKGEVMRLNNNKVDRCTGDGQFESLDLINGNVNDTLAYYAAIESSGLANANAQAQCRERGGIYIAIGCVDPTPLGILTGLIRIAFGIMGGVALAQLIYAGVMYQSGDEEKIAAARSKVLSTIGGIAVLVFSVLILRIIGVNILDVIPSGAI